MKKLLPLVALSNHRHSIIQIISILLLAVIIGKDLTFAQDFSSLRGSVTDPAGALVSEASVTLSNLETGSSRQITTDETGSFQFQQLHPGFYSIRVEKTGFKTYIQERVQLLVATSATVKITLNVGEITENIMVASPLTPTLNLVDATMGNPINEREIKGLPFLARNPVNLLTLQPGVLFTGQSDTDLLFLGSIRRQDTREGAVSGIRGNQTNISVDGADSNDWETQGAFSSALPLTLDALQEFRVITSGANATEGVAGGAQVLLVTRGGSNNWHGNARWYHRNTATAANSFFNNQTGLEKPRLHRHIFGGSLGGPLIKDRAFFFLDYERRKDASDATELRFVPTETLKQGILRYVTTSGNIISLSPAQFRAIDPADLGPNPAVLDYFSLYPAGNDSSVSFDGGLNFTGLRFNAPIQTNNNIYTARFDFNITKDGKHSAFWRGVLGDISTDLRAAQFPGLPPASQLLNNSRGFVAGYTSQLSENIINNLRWGFTRQGIATTGGRGDIFLPSSFDAFFAGGSARANARRTPIHEIENDVTWTRGNHNIQTGASFRFIRNNRFTEANSFTTFFVAPFFCASGCRDAFDALINDGDPNNDPADELNFTEAYMMLTGAITLIDPTFLIDPKRNEFLPAGSPQISRFAENGIEMYVQDTWRLRPNLTITAGLRYSYYTPIWETNGFQVRPTFDVRDWWNNRQVDMYSGRPSDASPLLSWELAGRANGKSAWYDPDRNNFAPRLALAWSPDINNRFGKLILGESGKSVIRGGAGVYFHRVGGALADRLDRAGSPGLANSLLSPPDRFSLADAPRFSGRCDAAGCSGLPSVTDFVTPPASAGFPFFPSVDTSNFGFLVDNNLSTPYSMNLSLSVQRELPKAFTLDLAYVGTLGRQLTVKADLAQYYGFLQDPQSGQNFWGAYNQIVDLIGPDPFSPRINPNNSTALRRIRSIAFFENLLPGLPEFLGTPDLTPTQAFYVLATQNAPFWSSAPLTFDVGLQPGTSPWSRSVDPEGDGLVLFHPQFLTLPTWLNWGSSNYHSLQVSIRRNIGSALIGANYVLSKSIDNGSAPENADLVFNDTTLGQIPNAFLSGAHRAVSDFDVRHNFNAHWVVELPFGRGRAFAGNRGGIFNQTLGGWTTTGILRWRSGLPLTPDNDGGAPTNIILPGPATLIGSLKSEVTRRDTEGVPNLFPDSAAALSQIAYTRPGDVGSRNAIRGPSYFIVDLGLFKQFYMPWNEGHRLEFRVTAFNAFNNVNFVGETFASNLFSSSSNYGRLSRTADPRGGARELEFSLRFSF